MSKLAVNRFNWRPSFSCNLRGFEVQTAEGWREADALSPQEVNRKAVTYHRWCGKCSLLFTAVH
eukprot:1143411-Pelagomonas_calceolata.AAC.2